MLLPYSTLVFQSALSEAQLMARLQGSVEPERWFRLRAAERPFEGVVEGRTFRIRRIIRYRNSFLPSLHTPDGGAGVLPAIGGMLVFGVVLVLGGFGFEASKARQLLENVFSARQTPIGSAAA